MQAVAEVLTAPDRPKPVSLPEAIKRIVVILLKPTSYDDDGFPYRFRWQVIPSNSLGVMNAITLQTLGEIAPATPAEVHVLEDNVKSHSRRLARLHRRFTNRGFFAFVRRWWYRLLGRPQPDAGTKLVVGLVGVQTAQFPRACDLMDRWQKIGATCVIGGFHVSGQISALYDGIVDPKRPNIPQLHLMPPEIKALMDRGIIVFHGEAEDKWRETLADILAGTPKQLYRGGLPDITDAPLPVFPPEYFRKSFATVTRTTETGRGCPFTCDFCSVINVQGREVRPRNPRAIVDYVRHVCIERGSAAFFFTDDNLARNKLWGVLTDGLIEVREEGHRVGFMAEVDLASGKIPGFIPKLAAAGCTSLFMGVESMNQANLESAHKHQNNVAQYRQLWQLCHDHGIHVHAAMIIGFPFDTPESVEKDVDALFDLGVDQASFFILSPVPGSEIHVKATAAGVRIDPDFNRCDSFHAIVDHPTMTREVWEQTYRKAWEQFYSVQHMVAAMKRTKDRTALIRLLRYYVWYRWSFATEGTHPMIAGFYRYRDYDDRRPGSPKLPYGLHAVQEVLRHMRYARRLFGEFFRFQQVMFEVDLAPLIAEKREELSGRARGFGDWLRRTFGRAASREWLNAFWREYAGKKWWLLSPHTYHLHLLTVPHLITEAVYTVRCAKKIPRLIRISTTS